MLHFKASVRVFVCCEATDMRRSFESLTVLVESVLKEDPLSGHLFAFVNRRRDYVKVLYWEPGGYCLWSKRLEAGTYRVPKDVGEKIELSVTELAMMLEGIELAGYRRRKRYKIDNSVLRKKILS